MYRSCFGCTKLIENQSLRHKVALLEDETKFTEKLEALQSKLDRTNNRIASQKEEIRLLTVENSALKNKIRYMDYRVKEVAAEKDKRHSKLMQQYQKEKEKEIKELKDKIVKLESQVHKNSRNSSKPSSMEMAHPKIQNNRKKSGLKPGGQPGHKGHHLAKKEPTEVHRLEPSEEIAGSGEYYKTGRIITKQLIKIGVTVSVIQYEAEEFRKKGTGERYHAAFPDGMINEVTYDATVKAFASLLHTHGNVSYDKIHEILLDLSDGKLDISCGTLAALEKEFSEKSEPEREEIKKQMLDFPYAHVDGTSTRVNGKQEYVTVFTSPAGTLLYAKEHKGFRGVEDTAAEEYEHTLVHDCESTFFNFGDHHQLCLIHEMRYLLGSIENEPHLTWALKMRDLMQEMIHAVNLAKASGSTGLDREKIEDFHSRYDSILSLAEEEYKKHPPNMKYYGDGKKIMNRLVKHRDAYLYFLDHIEIPPTNNAAELAARKTKMHSKQSGGYRNRKYAQYFCDTLSVLESSGKSRYKTLLDVFAK